jgi:hypothetical protein
MKPQESKDSRMKRRVSRVWIGLAAVTGAAIAYLADPERGRARREAAARQISGAAQAAADRTSRWRNLVSSRLPGQSRDQLPEQVAVPSEPGVSKAAPSRAKSVERPAETGADTKKAED